MTKDKARDAWDDLYSKHGIQFGGAGDLEPLLKVLEPQMLVLDVGCGDGKSTEAIARSVEVVGCDFSREALKYLRNHRDFRHGVNLVECEMCSLPFGHNKFDAISCVHSLSHLLLNERKAAATEMLRVVKPGGPIFIEAFDCEDLRFGHGAEIESSTYMRGNGILTHYFRKGEIATLFPSASQVVETRLSRRVALGSKVGKRSVVRVLVRKKS